MTEKSSEIRHDRRAGRREEDQLFWPFEWALQEFHLAGGTSVTAIRAPAPILREYLRGAPHWIVPRYMNCLVELAVAQDGVSVRGTTVTGDILEYPNSTG